MANLLHQNRPYANTFTDADPIEPLSHLLILPRHDDHVDWPLDPEDSAIQLFDRSDPNPPLAKADLLTIHCDGWQAMQRHAQAVAPKRRKPCRRTGVRSRRFVVFRYRAG